MKKENKVDKVIRYIGHGILIIAFGLMPFCVYYSSVKIKKTYVQRAVDNMPAGYYMIVDNTHYYNGHKNITYKYVKLVKTRNSTLIYVSNDLKHWTQTFDIDVSKLSYMSPQPKERK